MDGPALGRILVETGVSVLVMNACRSAHPGLLTEPATQAEAMDAHQRVRAFGSLAQEVMDAGVEKIRFAWAGGTERRRPHYYRLQGPSFLVEYDNTQNDVNHVHSVWRDPERDFGGDLLREHVRNGH